MRKIKISRRTIKFVVSSTVLLLVLGFIYLILSHKSNLMREINSDNVNIEDIQAQVDNAVKNHTSYECVVDVMRTYNGEETFSGQEAYTDNKVTKYKSYLYRDSEDNDLYQCWFYDDDNSNYDVYIYSDDAEAWVHENTEKMTESMNAWTLFENLSSYSVEPETSIWDETGDECYVLNAVNTEVMGVQIYEEVYIRTSDFMPVGILTYGSIEAEGDITEEDSIELDGGQEAEVEVTHSNTEEVIQKVSVKFSNDDLSLFDVPEEYISVEEYSELMQSNK